MEKTRGRFRSSGLIISIFVVCAIHCYMIELNTQGDFCFRGYNKCYIDKRPIISQRPKLANFKNLFSAPKNTPPKYEDIPEIQHIRAQFPVLHQEVHGKPLIYFDNAATSLKPTYVIEAVTDFYRKFSSNVHRASHSLAAKATQEYEKAREDIGKLLGNKSGDQIVFTSGATEGLNLIAYSFGDKHVKEGDEILVSVAEHHSNLVPWQQLAHRKNAFLKFVQLDSEKGEIDFEDFEKQLSKKTRIFAFQDTSNVLGIKNNLKKILNILKSYPHVYTVLDACQGVPHHQVEAGEFDFVVGSGHKMLGPSGIGFLCSSLLSQMSPWKFGGEMIQKVGLRSSEFRKGGAALEAGTPPIEAAIGMGAAARFLLQNMPLIEEQEARLTRYLLSRIRETAPDFQILGPSKSERRTSLVALYHPDVHAYDLATFLDYEGVQVRAGHHCCEPLHEEILGIHASLRASLAFYNTHKEIDRFVDALRRTTDMLLKIHTAA